MADHGSNSALTELLKGHCLFVCVCDSIHGADTSRTQLQYKNRRHKDGKGAQWATRITKILICFNFRDQSIESHIDERGNDLAIVICLHLARQNIAENCKGSLLRSKKLCRENVCVALSINKNSGSENRFPPEFINQYVLWSKQSFCILCFIKRNLNFDCKYRQTVSQPVFSALLHGSLAARNLYNAPLARTPPSIHGTKTVPSTVPFQRSSEF